MDQEVQHKLERIVAGDQAAAAWLYDAFATLLFRRLRRRYGYLGDAEIEDLLQDVFLQVFNKDCRLLRSFMERSSVAEQTEPALGSYLWDLACGLATNRRRAASVRKVVALGDAERPSPVTDAESWAISRDTLARLDACLKLSGDRVYLYCKLRYQGGFSPEEITRMMGWSRKATYKLKQSLNEALHKCVKKLGLGVTKGASSLVLAIVLLPAMACSPSEAPANLSVTLRGHEELALRQDGETLPLFLGLEPRRYRGDWSRGLCLEVPFSADVSQWQISLRFDGQGPSPPRPPSLQMGTTLCFDITLPANLPVGEDVELCPQVQDLFDQSTFALPCELIRYQPDHGERDPLAAAFLAWRESRPTMPRDDWLRVLEGLVERATAAGFPVLAAENLPIAAWELRQEGQPQGLETARQILEALPPWLAQPEASEWAAKAAYEKAQLELAAGWRLASAWDQLQQAEAAFRRIAHPLWVLVTMKQAEILSRIGSLTEAQDRFRTMAEACVRLRCQPHELAYANSQRAWLILQQPDLGHEDLKEAERRLEAVDTLIHTEGRGAEYGNHLVNLAYLRVQQGTSPGRLLAEARSVLTAKESPQARARLLLAWADLVEGIYAASQGEHERALHLLDRVSDFGKSARLAARALSYAGRVHRERGDLDQAQNAFTQAIRLHEYVTPESLGQTISLGPGHRADDFYQAARVALERNDAAAAWSLLTRLDQLGLDEAQRQRCRERATDPLEIRRWQERDRKIDELLQQLIVLDAPTSIARRDQQGALRRPILEQLQRLSRQTLGCTAPPTAHEPQQWGLRAVALEDEILLLRRNRRGDVSLEQRTPLERQHVRSLIQDVAQALEDRRLEDQAWRQLVLPLARALIPQAGDRPEAVTPYALHGLLQGVPLAALPIETGIGEEASPAPRWLADTTTVVVQTMGGSAGAATSSSSPLSPLFIVDPTGNLASAERLRSLYGDLFPRARILMHEDASRGAFVEALPRASFLHLDLHASYDAGFPDLSSLYLADGELTLTELVRLSAPRRLVNLSGCQTGRWPITADSGRYGIAGLFARNGTAWVVASRAQLADTLARDFNLAFYQATSRGLAVPTAYREALAVVQQSHAAVDWAALFLLRAGGTSDPSAAGAGLSQATPLPNLDSAYSQVRDDLRIDSPRNREIREVTQISDGAPAKKISPSRVLQRVARR